MFGYVSGFFQMKQRGLDLDHLLWRKVVACLNFLFFSTQHQLLKLDFLVLKKKYLLQSQKEKKYCILVWESCKVPNPSLCLPPFSTGTGDYDHWSLMPPLVPRLCAVAEAPGTLQALNVGLAAATAAQRGGLAGWPPRRQTWLCSGCRLLAVAAGGKAVVWVCPSQPALGESPSGRGARSKVNMSLA